jgi:hypothetical protein
MNGARDVLVVDNRVTFADWGIVYDGSTGAIRDNLNSGVTSPYVAVNGLGWTDAGNNH